MENLRSIMENFTSEKLKDDIVDILQFLDEKYQFTNKKREISEKELAEILSSLGAVRLILLYNVAENKENQNTVRKIITELREVEEKHYKRIVSL